MDLKHAGRCGTRGAVAGGHRQVAETARCGLLSPSAQIVAGLILESARCPAISRIVGNPVTASRNVSGKCISTAVRPTHRYDLIILDEK